MCALANNEVTLGVTQSNMNKSKKEHLFRLSIFFQISSKVIQPGVSILKRFFKEKVLHELIEPIEERLENVRQFLREIKPSLKSNVVPIEDMFGPSITITNLGCLVASDETEKGAKMVNQKRKELVRFSFNNNYM